MSFGKLYTYKGSPRALGILAVAKSIGLDLEESELQPVNGVPDFYWKLNPLGKTPTFEGTDGVVLTECMAIALYITNQDPDTTLMGSTSLDFINIIRWISLTNTDVVMRIAAWVRPLIGYVPYCKEGVDKAQHDTAKVIQIFEDHLRDRKYLVSDRLTLADIMCASLLTLGFAKVFDRAWREDFPYFTGWYMMVTHLPIFRAVLPEVPFVAVGLPNAPPTEPFKAP
ncbi:glutathione S-transferase psoE [Aspergillus glaucus CBS 516.65]|uniref:Glutathione S-transferase n=1 Tax=Aspergillus glaucus CBS 516.65 TaxID=1160497 RepID=A0A1L9VFW0_ASPGL|nr:hypothetical protein ASPGLDRAFT_48817 [Aspergillus glaucus CBS 516.65]OJJ82722.1 hypothetical protein ASPGLDRAFT_48817 [Aspergillus glaucus CBS 516.65]